MTLRSRLQDIERRQSARARDPRDMTTAELEARIAAALGYVPDIAELERLAATPADEGGEA